MDVMFISILSFPEERVAHILHTAFSRETSFAQSGYVDVGGGR